MKWRIFEDVWKAQVVAEEAEVKQKKFNEKTELHVSSLRVEA